MIEESDGLSGGFYGRRFSRRLGIESDCLLRVKRHGQLALAMTRLTCSRNGPERTAAVPSEPAFSILQRLDDLGGRSRDVGPFAEGPISVIDLMDPCPYEFEGPLEAVQYYIPRQALDQFAHEHGAQPVPTLKWDRTRGDPILSTLSGVLLKAVEQEQAADRLFVDQIGLSLLAHFAQNYGGMRPNSGASASGGLAPWQERRAKEIMRTRYASQLTIADVAAECRLTPSHFARSFRCSTGVAPHEFLSRIRIDEARRLMLSTKLPLADIALICGFGDQSYFTRVFSRSIGASPGAWRKSRVEGRSEPNNRHGAGPTMNDGAA
jgi:AraC family transcriptional regulator